ncbi:uncharacterized protein MYCFIDRAFT_178809 [Pseudocercospora fijiensis CIRAD86]|uniref:Uncharacterized protein n=1 Tax=Pseudocercospora fijiensis (strain CIRAD86) TaxID=383855 RepID=M3AMM2_PSEFD|nr:uncharacterized protein MYCFIDRAFT_178809 [Pseudocercospora fijiensis CIRAD86]EME78697.1 hypothetical protein MYCFIDRAFT_178809 [Pseudocercospora fijiensis CIRAD86]
MAPTAYELLLNTHPSNDVCLVLASSFESVRLKALFMVAAMTPIIPVERLRRDWTLDKGDRGFLPLTEYVSELGSEKQHMTCGNAAHASAIPHSMCVSKSRNSPTSNNPKLPSRHHPTCLQTLPQELYDLIYYETFTIAPDKTFYTANKKNETPTPRPVILVDKTTRPPTNMHVNHVTRIKVLNSYYSNTFVFNTPDLCKLWFNSLPSTSLVQKVGFVVHGEFMDQPAIDAAVWLIQHQGFGMKDGQYLNDSTECLKNESGTKVCSLTYELQTELHSSRPRMYLDIGPAQLISFTPIVLCCNQSDRSHTDQSVHPKGRTTQGCDFNPRSLFQDPELARTTSQNEQNSSSPRATRIAITGALRHDQSRNLHSPTTRDKTVDPFYLIQSFIFPFTNHDLPMETTRTRQNYVWSTLPPELYEQIYNDTFDIISTLHREIYINKSWRPPSILLINQVTRADLLHAYYSSRTFVVRRRDTYWFDLFCAWIDNRKHLWHNSPTGFGIPIRLGFLERGLRFGGRRTSGLDDEVKAANSHRLYLTMSEAYKLCTLLDRLPKELFDRIYSVIGELFLKFSKIHPIVSKSSAERQYSCFRVEKHCAKLSL